MREERAGSVVLAEGDVEVQLLGPEAGIDAALAFLDAAETATGAPLVDETERRRLRRLVEGADAPPHWHPLLVRRRGEPRGYAGFAVAAGGARADVAVDRRGRDATQATVVLLRALRRQAADHDQRRLEVWVRHATQADRRSAERAGFVVERELAVLGRRGPVEPPDPPPGIGIRTFRDHDEAAVVAVLAAAYAGTAEAGWDRERFRDRRAFAWFDPADILVAEDADGQVVGLHWTKRRRDGRGEVYNLAVHPDAHGRGLGRALLRAGLAHLAERGADDVILWVDRGNDAGLALYRSEGFTERWVDVAFAAVEADGPEAGQAPPRSPGGTTL